MFFRHYWFYALWLLPVHGRFSWLWRYIRVMLGYYDGKDKLVAWHRTELEKLDGTFRLQQDGLRLVAARERARAEGIGPMDPRYQDIFDFSGIDWREEARVHSDVLRRYKKTGKERMERLDEALRAYPPGDGTTTP